MGQLKLLGKLSFSVLLEGFHNERRWRDSPRFVVLEGTEFEFVALLDYLQIIPPTDPRQSDKEKVDNIVRGLKKLQSENDLVVFVVSSINRANYLNPVDFESFKESGGIEYTADVVWGLQLQILNDDLFSKDNKIKEKRETVRAAKKAIPRKIELLCLKNRYGVSSYSCTLITIRSLTFLKRTRHI